MKDRIKAIMKDLNMSQGDFAKFLGISASILSSIFNGRTNPTLSTVALIKEKVPNISYSWLIDGVGDMYVDDAKSPTGEQVGTQPKGAEAPAEERVAGNDSQVAQRGKKTVALTLDGDDASKNPDKAKYRVQVVTILFDDGHYETFVPGKLKI